VPRHPGAIKPAGIDNSGNESVAFARVLARQRFVEPDSHFITIVWTIHLWHTGH